MLCDLLSLHFKVPLHNQEKLNAFFQNQKMCDSRGLLFKKEQNETKTQIGENGKGCNNIKNEIYGRKLLCVAHSCGWKSAGIHCVWIFCLLSQEHVYRKGTTDADEEVTVVCKNVHSICVLLNAVSRWLGEWQSICLFKHN